MPHSPHLAPIGDVTGRPRLSYFFTEVIESAIFAHKI